MHKLLGGRSPNYDETLLIVKFEKYSLDYWDLAESESEKHVLNGFGKIEVSEGWSEIYWNKFKNKIKFVRLRATQTICIFLWPS